MAAALQEFTQEIVDSRELSSDSQKEILDLLQCVMEELGKNNKRNVSVFRLALQNIGPLVSVANVAAAHWHKLKQMLEHLVQNLP